MSRAVTALEVPSSCSLYVAFDRYDKGGGLKKTQDMIPLTHLVPQPLKLSDVPCMPS